MKVRSEAVLGRTDKSLGVWGKMISNIWSTRSIWEFQSFCQVLSLPVLFQQIGAKLTDTHALLTADPLNLITGVCDLDLLLTI